MKLKLYENTFFFFLKLEGPPLNCYWCVNRYKNEQKRMKHTKRANEIMPVLQT